MRLQRGPRLTRFNQTNRCTSNGSQQEPRQADPCTEVIRISVPNATRDPKRDDAQGEMPKGRCMEEFEDLYGRPERAYARADLLTPVATSTAARHAEHIDQAHTASRRIADDWRVAHCGKMATRRAGIGKNAALQQIVLACCICEGHSMSCRRALAHCFLGRFLPKLRRCHKHRRFFIWLTLTRSRSDRHGLPRRF